MDTQLEQPPVSSIASRSDGACISVVIPAFNAESLLAETLQSVRNQTVQPGEVIVVDDGSTDGTREIARAFGATVITLKNVGPSAARNVGARAASGEYIAFLDADDVWVPEKLAVQLDALRTFGEPAFSLTDYRFFDANGVWPGRTGLRSNAGFRKMVGKVANRSRIVVSNDADAPVLYESYFLPSACFARRADVLAIGGFDETLRAAEDYEFGLRLLRIVPGIFVMDPLVCYRKHPAQATATRATEMRSAFSDVAARVAEHPERYRAGDAHYVATYAYWRDYQLGMTQARYGEFAQAAATFERSIAGYWTLRANLGLVGSRIGQTPAGRTAFEVVRWLWKTRPGRR